MEVSLETPGMVGRRQFRKRCPSKRLAFAELYLREVFGQSNLVETRGRKKRQNLSNNLTKKKRQKQKPCGGTTSKENTSNRAACLKAAQHNPQERNAEGLKKTSGGPSRKKSQMTLWQKLLSNRPARAEKMEQLMQ